MNRFYRVWITLILVLASATANAELLVLSYHNVDSGKDSASNNEAMVISHKALIEQFSWLKANGYHVVSVDEMIAAQDGREPLPEKAVLLTFDDGYLGMYQQVFPILKLFNYPAVLALMGKWVDTPEGTQVEYGDSLMPREYFLSWGQIRKMADSGLVELASHSYDLHQGILANPQGNTQASAITPKYDAELNVYEDKASYRKRIYNDLAKNTKLIKQKTGVTPRVMVWPYGAYNQVTIEIARELGMPITMSLDEGRNEIRNFSNVRRLLVGNRSGIADFVWLINDLNKPEINPVRVVHVDLDYVYDPNPVQQERNLDKLVDRIRAMGISAVYLQAFADPDGDGNANSLYFPNRHLPMRADLFNRVAWQLHTRANVKVYAWMPVLAYDLTEDHPLSTHRVQAKPARQQEDYRRLSPFSEEALRFVGDIYEDLAMYTKFQGLIFHDDAYLSDNEDNSSWAIKAYQKAGLPIDIELIRKDPVLFSKWTLLKSEALVLWTDALIARVSRYQSNVKTARNMYASVIMNPDSEQWFAQSMDIFMKHYDYTAIMAMPYMEKAKNPEVWLRELVRRVESIPGALDKTVFELQSVNWVKKEPLQPEVLASHMRILLQSGAMHFGYYPDDFIQGKPSLKTIRPVISLKNEPTE